MIGIIAKELAELRNSNALIYLLHILMVTKVRVAIIGLLS